MDNEEKEEMVRAPWREEGSVSSSDAIECACWEVDVRPKEVERLLSGLRADSRGVIIQVFRMGSPPNPRAVEMIGAQTLAAAKTGSTLAERPELDLLLRLAGTRQIGDAFKRIGYKEDEEGVTDARAGGRLQRGDNPERGDGKDEGETKKKEKKSKHGEAWRERKSGLKKDSKLFMVALCGEAGFFGVLLHRIAQDHRFRPMAKRPLSKRDFEMVERAALLAAA
jgi:hypothetical protein